MPLHHSKKTALLNSLNCISSNDLTSLKDLSDGKIFSNILSTTFNESSDYVEQCESDTSVSVTDKIDNEIAKVGSVGIAVTESENVALSEDPFESENVDTKEGSPECAVVQIESSDGVDKLILDRFKFIQNFIDRKYSLKSDEIISYTKCIKRSEFELAKVAIFILSEVVRHFVLINNDHLSTLSHLDVRMQEDLEECFHLFIAQRERISKKDVEKLLSNHAKYKSQSPKSPFATPRRNCASKYKVDIPTTPVNEEIFSDSPLKLFFDSPVFKKEDMLRKEKELAKTRNNLLQEEIKADELQLELKDVKKKLHLKEKEIIGLKASMKMLESDKNSQDFEEQLKELQEKYDSLKKESDHKFKEYEDEISNLLKEKSFLEFEAKTNQGFSRYLNTDEEDLVNELIVKDTLLGKKNDMVATYRLKQFEYYADRSKLESTLAIRNNELSSEKQKRQDLEIQVLKEREFYAAKLSELKTAVKNEPQSPGAGENLGVIIEEENRILQLKLDDANLKLKQLEEKLELMVQPKENVPNSKNAFISTVSEGLDLANSGRSSMSAFEAIELLQTPKKFKKRHSDKCEELNDSLAECDMLNNSEIAFKKSSSSLHSNVVPFNNDTAELPTLKEYAVLWKNSSMEIDTNSTTCTSESSNKHPVNCDKVLNLCSKCNNNINGYNLNSGLLRELEKKDEEINNLNAKCETLEQRANELQDKCDILEHRTEDYSEMVDENKEEIKNLKKELAKADISYKECRSKYEMVRHRMLSNEEKFSKFKEMEEIYKKRERQRMCAIESLKNKLVKKDQEMFHDKEQMSHMYRTLKALKKKNIACGKQIQLLEIKCQEAEKSKEMEQKFKNMNEANPIETEKQNPNQKSESFFVDFNTDASKDMINESAVSGALLRKNGISLDSFALSGMDEECYLSQNDVSCSTEQDKKRVEELIRRNSILPHHLQSSYPIEMNLQYSVKKFYVKPTENVETVKCVNLDTEDLDHCSKKRKLQEDDTQSDEVPKTPLSRLRRTLNPSSLKKLLHFNRCHHKAPVRPKP